MSGIASRSGGVTGLKRVRVGVKVVAVTAVVLLALTTFSSPVYASEVYSEVTAVAKANGSTTEITVATGEAVTFDGSDSSTTGGGIVEYYWHFGDGAFHQDALASVDHSYVSEGAFDVTLVAEDDNHRMGLDTVRVFVHNPLPGIEEGTTGAEVLVSPSTSVIEDDQLTFDGSSSFGGDGTSFFWDFGDGDTAMGAVVQHSYPFSGSAPVDYQVTLRAVDSQAHVDWEVVTITVQNQVPTTRVLMYNPPPSQEILAGSTVVADEDQVLDFDASITEDTATDHSSLEYAWDFGDGTRGSGFAITHSYAKQGTFTVTLRVKDDNDASGPDFVFYVDVQNVGPVAVPGSYGPFPEGSTVVFDARSSMDTPSDQYNLTYAWDWDPGGGPNPYALVGWGATHNWYDDGSYGPDLMVVDDDGAISNAAATVNIVNEPPAVAITGVWWFYSGLLVEGYAFDPSSDDLTFEWDFWNGGTSTWTSYSGGSYPQEVFAIAGPPFLAAADLPIPPFLLTLTVTDDDGGVGSDEVVIDTSQGAPSGSFPACALYQPILPPGCILPPPRTDIVDNLAPVVEAWVADMPSAEEDEPGFFYVDVEDPDSTMFTYLWDFRDGTTSTLDRDSHAYDRTGMWLVTVAVTDDFGDTTVDSVWFETTNVIPTPSFPSPLTGDEDAPVTFDASATTDTSYDRTILFFHWNFGDGVTSQSEVIDHTYTDEGLYAVSLIVQDDNGAMVFIEGEVTVVNLDPVASVVLPNSGGENQPGSLLEGRRGLFQGGPSYDTTSDDPSLIYSWDFGEGALDTGRNPTHTYDAAGPFTITLTVTDNSGADSSQVQTLTGVNVLPEVYAGPDLIVYGGSIPITFRGQGHDTAGDATSLVYEWDFGDGATEAGTEVTHAYESSGTFTVRLTATDGDGASGFDEALVTVTMDSDGDMLGDDIEIDMGTDPLLSDTDGDHLVDFFEERPSSDTSGFPLYSTDASLLDSDYDGLDDWEELFLGGDGFITDPNDPDYDDDGCVDGNERFDLARATETRHLIPDAAPDGQGGIAPGVTSFSLEKVGTNRPGQLWRIEEAVARVGISHTYRGDISIELYIAGYTVTLKEALSGDGNDDIYETYDLLAEGLPKSALDASDTATITVKDHFQGDTGFVEYFEVHITVRLDPTNADEDGDGLKDCEETIPGEDGWLTDPLRADTDGDSLDDGDEVYGTTKGVETNPTSSDSDADGFGDLVDNAPLHDMTVRVTIERIKVYDEVEGSHDCPLCPDSESDSFGVVTIDGESVATTHVAEPGDDDHTWNSRYSFDVEDDVDSVDIKLEAWDEEFCWGPICFDDEPLDISPQVNVKEAWITFDLLTETWSGDTTTGSVSGNDDGTGTTCDEEGNCVNPNDHDATLWFDVQRVDLNRANVMLVYHLDERGDGIGIYETPSGPWSGQVRRTGEVRFYVFYIGTEDDTVSFDPGANVILVPRKVFLESKLRELVDAGTPPSYLDDATYLRQLTDGDSSDLIAASILAELAGVDAEDLLTKLKQDQSSPPTTSGAHKALSTLDLARLGLGTDILQNLPWTGVVQSAQGNLPMDAADKILSWFTSLVVTVAEFLYQGLVWLGGVITAFLDAVVDALVFFGQVLVGLFSTALDAIRTAIAVVLKAFNDLTSWAWTVIESMLTPVMQVIEGALANELHEWKTKAVEGFMRFRGTGHTVKEAAIQASLPLFGPSQALFDPLMSALRLVDLFAARYVEILGGELGLINGVWPLFLPVIEIFDTLDDGEETILKDALKGVVPPDAEAEMNTHLNGANVDAYLESWADTALSLSNIPPGATVDFEFNLAESIPDPPDKFALLIGGCPKQGEPEQLFYNDIFDMYDVLINRGFNPANTHLLTCVNLGDARVEADSSRGNVQAALHTIATDMDATDGPDFFYLMIVGHGNQNGFGVFPPTFPPDPEGGTLYLWANLATDVNSEIGFGASSKYDTAIFVVGTSQSGSSRSHLYTSGGETDTKRVVFTATDSVEAGVSILLNTNWMFEFHYINHLEDDWVQAFLHGFATGIVLPAFLATISALIGGVAFGLIIPWITLGAAISAALLALAIAFVVLVVIGAIVGVIAAAGVYVGDTIWDTFDYARAWTQWGRGWWVFSSNHPQVDGEAKARTVIL